MDQNTEVRDAIGVLAVDFQVVDPVGARADLNVFDASYWTRSGKDSLSGLQVDRAHERRSVHRINLMIRRDPDWDGKSLNPQV
jgi:hypothetical protein